MSAFLLGLEQGANGIETDVQRTKDGHLVLFHDDDTARVTNVPGAIADRTYAELCKIPVRSADGTKTDTVPHLSDLLSLARERGVELAVELKAEGLEEDVLKEIDRFGLGEHCIVTSFAFDRIARVKALDPARRVGWLIRSVSEDVIRALQEIGGEQICPKAGDLTPELVERLHGLGLSVRAWGVQNEELMRHAYLCGVDGMTVNFPDKLTALLNSAK